ncbi:MAG: MFS transporter, partial [Promethearchaeota archaeon]
MVEDHTLFDEKIPSKEKIAYGTASSAHMYLSGIGLGVIDIFYLKATGIAPSAMALSWILFIVWNAINDPLIGVLQDKTKSKLGRRIPYLRYGSPIYVITFIWIWFPFITDQSFLFLNHLVMLFIFDTVFSMMGLIFYSMPAEMALTAKERGSIMIYTTALGAIGTLGAVIVPLIYLGQVPDIEGFRIVMIISGIAAGAIIYISSYYIKENTYTQMEETLGFFESIRVTFKNKPFLIVEVAIFAMIIMQNVITGYFIFIMDYLVVVELNILNIFLFLFLFVLIAYAIVWMNTHIEKYGLKKLMIVGGILGVLGFLSLLIVGLTFDVNQDNKMPFYLFFGPLMAILIGMLGFMLLNMPLMAECIDHDEVLTGKRRECCYSGV